MTKIFVSSDIVPWYTVANITDFEAKIHQSYALLI